MKEEDWAAGEATVFKSGTSFHVVVRKAMSDYLNLEDHDLVKVRIMKTGKKKIPTRPKSRDNFLMNKSKSIMSDAEYQFFEEKQYENPLNLQLAEKEWGKERVDYLMKKLVGKDGKTE